MPVLEACKVIVLGDTIAHARLDAHAGGVGVRGRIECVCIQGIVVAALERISTYCFHHGRRDDARSRVPHTEILGVAAASTNFRGISHTGGIAECLQYRRRIRLQAITARTGVTALRRREAVVSICADLLASGICVIFGVGLVGTDEGAWSGFVEAAKINIGIDCLAWGWD